MDGEIDRLQDTLGRRARSPPPTRPPRPPAAGTATAPRTPPATYRDGAPFAVMYIPRFGADWAKPVLEGTAHRRPQEGPRPLRRAPRASARSGNFSVAGHRRTYGDPFKDFPRAAPGRRAWCSPTARPGSPTASTTGPYTTVPGDIGVIDPVPRKSGFHGPGRYLTLTTCEPEWGHSHRLIAWAHLDSTQPAARGRPSALSG